MGLVLGPVLYFWGVPEGAWRLAALVAVGAREEPAALATADDRVLPQRLAERCGKSLWRYDFALPLDSAPAARVYRIARQSWRVHLPAESGALRIAYTACNGSELGDAWHDGRVRTCSFGCRRRGACYSRPRRDPAPRQETGDGERAEEKQPRGEEA